MNEMKLDDDEIALIERHRAEKRKRIERENFALNALKIAAGYEEWLQREGVGDSFSTFVNEYGYQGEKAGRMHETIKAIRQAAYPA
jgi:hypothetical protein